MRVKTRASMMIGAVLVCLAAAAWLFWPAPATPPAPVVATPAPAVAGMKPMTIQPKSVRALPPRAKRKLALPTEVQAATSIYALTASHVDPGERPRTLITTLDADTGEVVAYERIEPLPWIAPSTRGEVGISYGLRDGVPMGRLSLRQNLLQVKALRLGAQAHLDEDGEWFAGVGVWYGW